MWKHTSTVYSPHNLIDFPVYADQLEHVGGDAISPHPSISSVRIQGHRRIPNRSIGGTAIDMKEGDCLSD